MAKRFITKIINHPLLFAVFLSFLVSAIVLAYRQPLNNDGMIYLKTASLLLSKGFRQAMQYYHWPFYSILIAGISQTFHLSLLTTIYISNAILDAGTVIAFILLTRELGGSLLIQWISAAIILTFPYFTHLRDHVVRGHGYYVFMLFAMVFLIRYVRKHNLIYALLWGIAVVIATLFRIEGTVLLVMLPLVILVKPQQRLLNKFKTLFGAYFIPICCLAVVIFACIWHAPGMTAKMDQLHHMLSSVASMETIIHRYQHVTRLLIGVIGQPVQHDVNIIIVFGLLGLLIYKLVHVLTPFYTALAIYTFKRRLLPADWSAKAVLYTAMIANVLIVSFFVGQAFFISGRYWGLMSLLLLTFIPFAIIDIHQHYKDKIWVFPLVSFLLLLTMMSGLGHFGPSKTYLVAAGKWISQHTPPRSLVYTNDPQLLPYFHRAGNRYPHDYEDGSRALNHIFQQNIALFDYLAINLRHNDHVTEQRLAAHLHIHPMKCFHNHRGDRLLIYKLRNHTKLPGK